MNPLLLAGILSGITGLGGLFGGAGKDPYKEYLRRVQALTAPNAINTDAAALLRAILNSQGYAQAQRGVFASSNQLSNALARSLGARGLGTSGVGSVAGPLASSAGAFQLGNLGASASNQAYDLARQLAQMRIAGLGGALTQTPNIGGQLFGAGMTGLGNVFEEWLRQMSRPK